ncbi:MAG: DHHA1 domain-containing protein [Nitrososphaera sp.]
MGERDENVAHTAEHAFVGALQKILGKTLQVRKVEHKKDGSNTAFIAIPQLDVDTVVRAESLVNALIEEGRSVTTRIYSSLEEARSANPTLRANEARISGTVRVVDIAGHDVTACVKEHAGNLQECGFFMVIRLSKSGDEYEVDFAVGKQAKETAVLLSAKMMKVCSELGANLNTVENTARKVRMEGESAFKKLKALSREKLQSLAPTASGNIKVYSGAFSGLADEALQEFAGEKIVEPGIVVVLANAGGADSAYFILARSEAVDLDCNKVFREAAGADGRGGGKPHFVTGVVKKEKAEEIIRKISDNVLRLT